VDRKRRSVEKPERTGKTGHPAEYEIRIAGKLDPAWSEWLPGMRIVSAETRPGSAETALRGVVPDQSALRGILCKLWDLGLTVLLVERRAAGKRERRESP
jgi:hypothetical protein